ncbi:hypothetical protein GCM10007874_37530 [Labrys miyagiensis]|uniref:Uncharacterized protein n=1 Tax=Labrys miyagiensis TaxID=346912 RepID=A0ABQ6CRA2_9HYPH|nr:hypothetical protein GCM10007874_37530 [Labrys miyagiensis]
MPTAAGSVSARWCLKAFCDLPESRAQPGARPENHKAVDKRLAEAEKEKPATPGWVAIMPGGRE